MPFRYSFAWTARNRKNSDCTSNRKDAQGIRIYNVLSGFTFVFQGREPKIVNGPEILNKFVGQAEENIRKLFLDAEEDQKANGDDADLHIIIFDEMDAICKVFLF